jgi:hypothetical protein
MTWILKFFGFETREMRMARWHCLSRQMMNGYAHA